MWEWIKTGVYSSLISVVIFAFVFFTRIIRIFGLSDQGIIVFYAICFVVMTFFMGNIIHLIRIDENSIEIEHTRNSRYILLFLNGLAFFLVLGFGFAIEIFRMTLNNLFSLISILVFFIAGVIAMTLVLIFYRYKLDFLFIKWR